MTTVAAARPIIEAERDEHWRNDETIRELLAIHEAVTRERIAAEIEARLTRERERHARNGYINSFLDGLRTAARIARGQS